MKQEVSAGSGFVLAYRDTSTEDGTYAQGHAWHWDFLPQACLLPRGVCVYVMRDGKSISAPDLIDRLADAVELGELSELDALLRLDAVTLNEARGSIQVWGCSGTVIGNIPLAPVGATGVMSGSTRLKGPTDPRGRFQA